MKVLVVPIVTVFLLVAISAGSFMFLIKPQREALASKQDEIEDQRKKLDSKSKEEEKLGEAKIALREAQKKMARYEQEKGIRISLADPDEAAFRWYQEITRHSAPHLRNFLERSGVSVMEGVEFPAPPDGPPTVVKHDMVAIPDTQAIPVSVQGTLEEIETLYRSVDAFPRVLVIDGLTLEPTSGTRSGTDVRMLASFNMHMYALVESTGEAAAAAPSAGRGAPSAGRMMGGPSGAPGMGPGMPPGMMAPPAGGSEMGPGAMPGGEPSP